MRILGVFLMSFFLKDICHMFVQKFAKKNSFFKAVKVSEIPKEL